MRPELALPMAAERLIPHRTPMRLVETLLSVQEGRGVTESVFPRTSLMADGEGRLDEVTFLEMIAQSYSAYKGYIDLVEGKPVSEGFLVGVRHLEVTGRAYAGERLRTSIGTVATFGGFAVVEGSVTRGDETIASGSIKLWLVEDGR